MPKSLHMVWPVPERPKETDLPPGYNLRSFREGEEDIYIQLLNRNKELGEWDLERFKSLLENPLSPRGIYVVTYDNLPVATACAIDISGKGDKKKGEIYWVAVDPIHQGKNLGMIVCAAAVNHLLKLGYEEICLHTNHWRIPAVKTYLKLGFEPVIDGPDDRFIWVELCEKLKWKLPDKFKKAKYVKGPKGEEVAYRTLNLEKINEPCIIVPWCMKREFFQKLTHQENIYQDAPRTMAKAFILAGANLCPQFIMPGQVTEHQAESPWRVAGMLEEKGAEAAKTSYRTPEEVRDYIESLPDPHTLQKDFNFEREAEEYARLILTLREMTRGEMLVIQGFGQADFMGGYVRFGYINYLEALALYPEHLKRYYAYTGEEARLQNIAFVHVIEKYNLAPFVYGGQDICFNDGPICSLKTLDELYFSHLVHAVEPLHQAGIKIIWHCDGDVRPIVDRLIYQVGVAGYQGFQEETGCTLEHMAKFKTREGKKLILWGSISVTTTLPFGTVDEVKKDVERCFRIAAPGGGFALASSSSILPETPYENIIAMFEHGVKFGREFLSGCY